jgi:hypothetical protein
LRRHAQFKGHPDKLFHDYSGPGILFEKNTVADEKSPEDLETWNFNRKIERRDESHIAVGESVAA